MSDLWLGVKLARRRLLLRRAVDEVHQELAVVARGQAEDAALGPIDLALLRELQQLVAVSGGHRATVEPPHELIDVGRGDVRVGLLAQAEVEDLVETGGLHWLERLAVQL